VLESSFSGNIAARFGRQVRNISQLPLTRLIFPALELSEDSQAKNKFDTTEGGYYVAAGRDGSITSYGADIMILDDLYSNKGEADSETIRDNIWDTYLTVFRTRLHQDSALVLLMTRWHDADLIGKVLGLEGRDDQVRDPNTGAWRTRRPDDPEDLERGTWHVVDFPAIATKDDGFRKTGEALWPEKYPLDYLRSLEKLNPDVFSCMYQCTPLNEATSEFKRSWFRSYEPDELPSNLRIYITVDLAISKKDTADEVSIIVTGITSDLSVYILDHRHGRPNEGFDPSETIEHIFQLADLYRPIEIGVEAVQYQAALVHFMEKEMKKRGKILNISEIHTTSDKEMKIRGLIPYYKMGRIYHLRGECNDVENQLLRFPKGANDDMIDSLAMAIPLWEAPAYARPLVPRPKTLKQAMKEEGIIRR
jgi:predicted phage terminase large subunit-like protein